MTDAPTPINWCWIRPPCDDVAALRSRLDPSQVTVLQLTHSGRFARPSAGEPAPRTVYQHPLLDARVASGPAEVFSDDELDELVEQFIHRALLAQEAGFDFVDIKACHGYLGHEFLSAIDRPGRYGGDLEGRTRFLRSIISGIRERAPKPGRGRAPFAVRLRPPRRGQRRRRGSRDPRPLPAGVRR